MKTRRLSIIVLILLGAARASASEVDEFLKSYRESRIRLLTRYENCRATGVETETVTKPGVAAPVRRFVQEYEYTRTGVDEKLSVKTREAMIDGEDKLDLYPSGTIIRRGDRLYAVKRSIESGDFSLVVLGSIDDPRIRDLNRNRDRLFHPTCDGPGFNLPLFLDKPELSIQSVKEENRDGESLVRVDYTITHKTPKAPVQRAWCLLRPDLDWSLREFETIYEGSVPFSYSGVVSYEPGPSPKPKTLQQKLILPGSMQVYDFSYDRFDFVKSPAKDFSLAVYGLGEVESLPSKPKNHLPYWFGGVAAIALILSLWLRIVANRRELSSTKT